MNKSEGVPSGSPQRLDYLYKEYVRLSEQIESYIKSSFEDFKLLGAIGALLAWPPIARAFDNDETSQLILLVGLVAILFIVTILGVRNMLKLSLIAFYLEQVHILETEIRIEMGASKTDTFRFAESWVRYHMKRHGKVAGHFQFLFVVLLLVFPIVVLRLFGSPIEHIGVFTAVAVLAAAVSWSARRELNRDFQRNFDRMHKRSEALNDDR